MEEKKQSMGITTLGYGVILAVVAIIYSLLLFVLDVDNQSSLNYLSYVILVAGIIVFQINYRNKHLGGFISYGKAFMVGFLTVVFYSIVMAIFTYVFFVYIDPGAIEEIKMAAEEGMIEGGMSDQEIDQAMKFVELMQTHAMLTMWALLGNIVVGAILSLITSIFVKKEGAGEI
jgi:hypothetical protein